MKILMLVVLMAFAQNGIAGPLPLADEAEVSFSIFLVRHAEKLTDGAHAGDPPLTACGRNRANDLATLLRGIDLARIYSSDFDRTRQTAAPIAHAQSLEPTIYATDALPALARTLRERRETALVVGHSNTTGVLAGLLGGETIGPFDEAIYDRLYQVFIRGDRAQLQLLHMTTDCED